VKQRSETEKFIQRFHLEGRKRKKKLRKIREEEKEMPVLLVIDMQNDFCSRDGSLFLERSESIIGRIADTVKRAKEAGFKVIYTQDWHREDDTEFKLWPKHCVENTWGAEIVKDLPKPDCCVKKRRYSAFLMTDLPLLLNELKERTLFVAGVATDVCVMHTSIDGIQMGYDVKVLKDCTAGTSEENEEFALKHMEMLGCELVSSEIIQP